MCTDEGMHTTDVTPTVSQFWTGPVELGTYTGAESEAGGCAMMIRCVQLSHCDKIASTILEILKDVHPDSC